MHGQEPLLVEVEPLRIADCVRGLPTVEGTALGKVADFDTWEGDDGGRHWGSGGGELWEISGGSGDGFE